MSLLSWLHALVPLVLVLQTPVWVVYCRCAAEADHTLLRYFSVLYAGHRNYCLPRMTTSLSLISISLPKTLQTINFMCSCSGARILLLLALGSLFQAWLQLPEIGLSGIGLQDFRLSTSKLAHLQFDALHQVLPKKRFIRALHNCWIHALFTFCFLSSLLCISKNIIYNISFLSSLFWYFSHIKNPI